MTEVEFRRFQESIGDFLRVKDELAKAIFGLYVAFKNAGFTETQAMYLVKETLIGIKP